MSFGYNATVFGNTSVAGVRENARMLLELLRDKREDNVGLVPAFRPGLKLTSRQEDPYRPIVFIGHSLGGIIIKQVAPLSQLAS